MQASIDTFVIGAGLTGLILASRLTDHGARVQIAEKAKGVGGRMATRRSDVSKFDHGAQFYTLNPSIETLHERWLKKALVTHWFDSERGAHFKSEQGMTALAKDLSSGLDLFLEVRIVALSKQEVGWKIASDKGVEYQAERVILTAPLPQSLDLLRQSQIKYQPELDKISYAKAIVALIEVENAKSDLAFENGYQEPKGGSLFSIADQKAKGLSNVAALTVTLSPDASESLYETSDDRIVEFVSSELRNLEPTFLAKTIQIKKWRYSHPLSRYPALYESPVAGLYLAGDAFGGPSLNGSARSAHALADFLTETRRPKES